MLSKAKIAELKMPTGYKSALESIIKGKSNEAQVLQRDADDAHYQAENQKAMALLSELFKKDYDKLKTEHRRVVREILGRINFVFVNNEGMSEEEWQAVREIITEKYLGGKECSD